LLDRAGRPDQALAAAQEAVQLCRQHADPRAVTVTPDLAIALGVLMSILTGMNRLAGAEAAAAEAVGQYRRLAAAEPDTFTIGLAGTLNYRAALLTRLGRPNDAQAAAEEAGRLRQPRGAPGPRPLPA
jgi:hypothetical protein